MQFRFFSLPVLNADVFLTIFAHFFTTTKTKKEEELWGELDFTVLSNISQSIQRNED